MRRRPKMAGLLAVLVLSGGAAAQPAGPAAPMDVVALVDDAHDPGNLARSEPGRLADSTGVLAELRRTRPRSMSVSGPVTSDPAKQPQPHGSLVVIMALILLAIGIAVHAWHDNVMNNRTL